jgi:hypothetical protein
METLALVSGLTIFAGATWAVFSPKVNDGIVLKHLLIGIAIAAFAFAIKPTYNAGAAVICCAAVALMYVEARVLVTIFAEVRKQ